MVDDDIDPYQLLGVDIEATEGEIKTAYRQRSLKVHPDKHPNNPDAAHKFHELNQAYELLRDPIRKTALDAKLRAKLARKERFAKFDVKRKGMQSELEEAERAAKRAKMERQKEERERREEVERIKEEGRRMRAEKQASIARAEEERLQSAVLQGKHIELGPLDTTVRLKYPLSQHPSLTTTLSLSALLSIFGPIDEASIVISMKPSKKAPDKPPKQATALVPFRRIEDAHSAVCASGKDSRGLKDIQISWAGGREPEALITLMQQDRGVHTWGHEPPNISQSMEPPIPSGPPEAFERPTSFMSAPSFSFDPSDLQTKSEPDNVPGLSYEALTMMRLRQAERERLEKEIREQEAIT